MTLPPLRIRRLRPPRRRPTRRRRRPARHRTARARPRPAPPVHRHRHLAARLPHGRRLGAPAQRRNRTGRRRRRPRPGPDRTDHPRRPGRGGQPPGDQDVPQRGAAARRRGGRHDDRDHRRRRPRPLADTLLRTCPQEKASTHTVSYVTALTLLARLVAAYLGDRAEPLTDALRTVPDALRRTLDLPLAPAAVDTLAEATAPVLVAGTGLDAITAAEAALKIKEGTYRWAEALHTEFALHGTPAVFTSATAGFLIRPAWSDGGRTDDLGTLLRALGAPVFLCDTEASAALPFAPVPDLVRPLVTVVPFQRLVSAAAARTGRAPTSPTWRPSPGPRRSARSPCDRHRGGGHRRLSARRTAGRPRGGDLVPARLPGLLGGPDALPSPLRGR